MSAAADRKHKDTRSAPAPRSWGRGPGRRRPFRPLRWAWLLLLVALLAPAYDLFLPAGWQPARERRTVVIDRGESLHNISTELQRVGLIRSQVGFLVLARVMQLDRTVKAGQYSFRVGITVPALLRALDKGMFGLNLVTIPEGLMISETALLIQKQVGIRANAIDSLAHDPAMLDSLDVSAPSLEGWLAPDSYEWLPGTSPEVVLRTMVARTRDRVQRATAGYDSLPLGMNAHEVLTLASIVESESRAEVERPRIARVYLNRLDRGMLLQADPTVGYALGRGPRSRLTFKDLRVESPYNTYRHEGLPPGPICSPGLSAIEAVMHATPGTNDLYFVSNGQGRHIFAPSYEKHLANIAFVKGLAAAREAAARRETAGRALPDSGEAEVKPSHAGALAAATRTAPPATHAATSHTATGLGKGGIKAAAVTPVNDTAVRPAATHAAHPDSAAVAATHKAATHAVHPDSTAVASAHRAGTHAAASESTAVRATHKAGTSKAVAASTPASADTTHHAASKLASRAVTDTLKSASATPLKHASRSAGADSVAKKPASAKASTTTSSAAASDTTRKAATKSHTGSSTSPATHAGATSSSAPADSAAKKAAKASKPAASKAKPAAAPADTSRHE